MFSLLRARNNFFFFFPSIHLPHSRFLPSKPFSHLSIHPSIQINFDLATEKEKGNAYNCRCLPACLPASQPASSPVWLGMESKIWHLWKYQLKRLWDEWMNELFLEEAGKFCCSFQICMILAWFDWNGIRRNLLLDWLWHTEPVQKANDLSFRSSTSKAFRLAAILFCVFSKMSGDILVFEKSEPLFSEGCWLLNHVLLCSCVVVVANSLSFFAATESFLLLHLRNEACQLSFRLDNYLHAKTETKRMRERELYLFAHWLSCVWFILGTSSFSASFRSRSLCRRLKPSERPLIWKKYGFKFQCFASFKAGAREMEMKMEKIRGPAGFYATSSSSLFSFLFVVVVVAKLLCCVNKTGWREGKPEKKDEGKPGRKHDHIHISIDWLTVSGRQAGK